MQFRSSNTSAELSRNAKLLDRHYSVIFPTTAFLLQSNLNKSAELALEKLSLHRVRSR